MMDISPLAVNAFLAIGGRALVALLFILAGVAKLASPSPTLAHMRQFKVPGVLLILVVALELGGGLCLLVGFEERYAALALSGFCLLAALIFHRNLADKAERTLFFKDIAIAGGLMAIAAAA